MAIIGISGKIGSGKDLTARIIQFLTLTGIEGRLFGQDIHQFLTNDKGVASHHPMHKWKVKKFAYKLKQIVSILTGCSVDDLESQEFKASQMSEDWNWFTGVQTDSEGRLQMVRLTPTEEAKKMLPFPNRIRPYTYREMLQRVGTEAMRNQIHENVWVNALFADYRLMSSSFELRDISKIREANDKHSVSGETHVVEVPNWVITDVRFPNEAKAIKDRNGILIRVERDYTLRPGAPEDPKLQHPSETALDSYEFDYVIQNDGTIDELVEKVREILQKESII